MKKSDRKLGMHRKISRRDFIHDAGIAAFGMSLPLGVVAAGTDTNEAYYPPTRTGLRGSHPGAFETAHALAREGRHFAQPTELDEEYDLVIVGAGISGLAAAWYYRQQFGADARILLLENHDDFGGHAKRNEFHQGGDMRLAMGGTQNLEYWEFSPVVSSLMDALGVDVEKMRTNQEFNYGNSINGENAAATWFDADSYGENKLVTGYTFIARPGQALAAIDEFPLSEMARVQLKQFYTMRKNILEGKSEEQALAYMKNTAYTEFLRQYGGLGDEARQIFNNAMHSYWGFDLRNLSVAEALEDGLPGGWLLGEEPPAEDWEYPVAMFPDGNASIARLLAQRLIPDLAPGTTADNVALAQFDYSRLDRPESPIRIRLNATVINAVNTKAGVAVTYTNNGESLRVRARHCVMACYNVIIPHLCPDLPEAQQAAQKYQVKTPLLQTNVLIRSSEAMDKLGITGAHCPGRMHEQMFLSKGINTGGYRQTFADGGAVPLTFSGSISPPADIIDLKDQLRAARAIMLGLNFEDYEREVRSVLDGMLGPAGFDVQRDILAITVNRWPHGYSYEYMDLWDPEWPEDEAPHEIARRPHGNITIANSDAGAHAYTHAAIDEAYRAVRELRSAG